MRVLLLAVFLPACESTDRTIPANISDPQAIGILEALIEAEGMELAPVQADGYAPMTGSLASSMIDDETALQYRLQQLGIYPASTTDSERERLRGRKQQEAFQYLVGEAVDTYFKTYQRASHAERIAFVVGELLTRCHSTCDLERDYVHTEQAHAAALK